TGTYAAGQLGTSYLGFHWSFSVDHADTLKVVMHLSNGTTTLTDTLSNCTTVSNAGCVAKYVPSNWLSDLVSGILGIIFGSGSNTYATTYVTYYPPAGYKVVSMDMVADSYVNCVFVVICSNVAQQVMIDNLSYGDPLTPPDHLEVTTASASA